MKRRVRIGQVLAIVLLLCSPTLRAQPPKEFVINSPDSSIRVHVVPGAKLQWSVELRGERILAPSAIALRLGDGSVPGENARIVDHRIETIDTSFSALNYRKSTVRDRCNQLTLLCNGEYGVVFRVYNDAVAYRFVMTKGGEVTVQNEEANFNFAKDHRAFIAYMCDYRNNKIFNSSFENTYREIRLSQFAKDSLAFLPLLVDIGAGRKVVVLEADLEEYPGMYLALNRTGKGFRGVFAPYPLESRSGGYMSINDVPTKRARYIARTGGSRSFPWRAIAISESDRELLDNDLVQKLASPPRIADVSWIRPGQVAWDWWNAWNISRVNFKAGINTATYRYYIDFAAANRIPYIIMDDGWSDRFDLTKISPAIDLREIVDYGREKGVGVILWACWVAVRRQMDEVFPLYAGMGVKGFKIDFIDRDDQKAVASTYEMAKKAAANHLIIEYHGIFKPTGLQRTYPNVLGYEGVKGLEYMKWADFDAPRYTVSIPFIRMMAGPMDYTPGAMRNATRAVFRPVNDMPMSQGTRCHQMAMYIVYDTPLQMLSDNPTVYMREQECTDFIVKVPTTFDETAPLDGRVGEYVAIARRRGETWFVGAMGNWDARELTLPLSFLGSGAYQAVVFRDGVNAHRDATDYVRDVLKVSRADTMRVRLSPGGGWAARFEIVK